jgi:membrane-associated phospholipid phosphatase
MKFSKFISYFFHPINFPIIGTLVYFLFVPKYIFKPQEHTILLFILVSTYILPIALLYIFKRLKFITSYRMPTIDERKFPTLFFLFLTLIIANWLFKTTVVDLLALLFLGYAVVFAITYGLLFLKIKLSLHTAAVGGLIGFLIYFSLNYEINLILLLIVLFIVAGLVSSSRVHLKAHTSLEVFLGFTIGILTQIFAFTIYYIM